MRNLVAVVLGGGKGTRLYPLTQHRSKPAVPLGGKYRLIDIPISNCLNSGINRIYLLTQFNSVSLHSHIRQSYTFDRFDGGFVEILAAQQTNEMADWYQGTADAVRKNLRYLEQKGIDYVLILSGDQLYRMDFQEMLRTHVAAKADVSIAGLPVDRESARSFGIMRFDDSGRVLGFLEKPQTQAEIDIVKTEPAWIDAHGIPSRGRDCIASMGIYLFNRDVLLDLLTKTNYSDFGKEVFPMSIRTHRVQLHLFDGYWEDIGTIRSFYDANLAMAQPKPPFSLADSAGPIFTQARSLPPVSCNGATLTQCLIAEGSSIEQGTIIENSVIGLRSKIGRGAVIRNSILMGSDYFETPEECVQKQREGLPPIGIGDNSVIEGAIIDKDCRIGRNVHLSPSAGERIKGHPDLTIEGGVIVVSKKAVLPDGWGR